MVIITLYMGDNMLTVVQILGMLIERHIQEEKTGNRMLLSNLSCEDRILSIVKEYLPSGSGIDTGTKICFERSRQNKIVLFCEYHHMTNGFYDGWTAHYITIRPSFQGIRIDISGKDRNGIKDYLYDTYHAALTSNYEW